MEAWENLKVVGKKIRVPNSTYEFLLFLFKDILIKTFPKYVHFNFDSIRLMVVGFKRTNKILHCIKYMRQIFFVFFQISKGIAHVLIWKLIPFHVKHKKIKVVEDVDVFIFSHSNDTYYKEIITIEYWHSIVQRDHIKQNKNTYR